MRDLVFFYGTLMAGFDRRRRAGIDDKLRYIGRGSIRGALFDLGLYPAAVPAPDGHVWGEVYEMAEPSTVLAALDEIEGYRHEDPDRSLYLRQQADAVLPDGTHAAAGVYFYNAPMGGATHRVRRLSRTYKNTMRILVSATLAASLLYAPVGTQAPGPTSGPAGSIDPRIVKLLDSVSEERLEQLLQKLVSFGTRNTLSDASSPTRGIGAARQWIYDELKRTSPRLQVSFDTHMISKRARITRDIELRNVMAVLPGRSPRRIYVSGHYDSVNLGAAGQQTANPAATQGAQSAAAPNRPGAAPQAPGEPAAARADPQQRPGQDYNIDAPGANDDGSGTVLSMELARVFATSGIEFDATLVFMAVAGEEQGLIGSGAYARAAREQRVPIQAWFNNDIVGNSHGGDGSVDSATIRVYSEGPEDSASRALAMFAARVGAHYVPSHRVRLMARRDRFSRSGDHSALNAQGFAAIGFRESKENYGKQHGPGDTIDGVDVRYLAQNARVNAAGMAVLALAPPPPVVVNPRGAPSIDRRTSGYDAHLRWEAAPGASAYRIFWRNAWAPDWEHELAVGDVTEYTFPRMNIDDWVFGVAAVDAARHESTVSAYVAPPRADGS